MNTAFRNRNGFTLIEILIAMAVGLVVMAIIYTFFYLQQKTYINQSEITAAQQDIVGAMQLMEHEIRLAGYDPSGDSKAGFKEPASSLSDEVRFTADSENENGNTSNIGEDLTYRFNKNDKTIERVDHNNGEKVDVLLRNVDAFNVIHLASDKSQLTGADNVNDTRAVQLTIVVRTGRPDYDYTDTNPYKNQQGTEILAAQNDHYRRRTVTAEILCRNMGLNATGGYGGSVIPVTTTSTTSVTTTTVALQ